MTKSRVRSRAFPSPTLTRSFLIPGSTPSAASQSSAVISPHYEDLEKNGAKLVCCHGKFYDIDETGQVDNIGYPRVFKALRKGCYKGYICSKFEGATVV